MLSKCANPRCAAVFQYLHDGKLFQVDTDRLGPQPASEKAPRSVEYFWLCAQCAASSAVRRA